MYICDACGALFETPAVWLEPRGTFWGDPAFEGVDGCPDCHGSYSEAIPCTGCGQRDPLVEYKMTGYNMFGEMTNMIAETTIRTLFNVRVEQKVEREEVAKVTGTNKDDTSVRAPKKREDKKVYPNDPCPCGSGKKYKQCCGRKPV